MFQIKKRIDCKNARENPKEYWNQKSEDFFKRLQNDVSNESYIIMEVLKEKGLYNKNLSILDVGCGFGRHIKFFQEISSRCVGLDISEKMLELAKEYVPHRSDTNFYCVDWDKEDFSLENKKKFSLVFSAMCQALNTEENLKKFIKCSSDYCMIERFLREDNPLTKLLPDIDADKPNNDWKYSRNLINSLWELGYYPESRVYSYKKEFTLSNIDFEYEKIKNINTPLVEKIEKSIKNEGKYKYYKYIVKILIFWNVKEKRMYHSSNI